MSSRQEQAMLSSLRLSQQQQYPYTTSSNTTTGSRTGSSNVGNDNVEVVIGSPSSSKLNNNGKPTTTGTMMNNNNATLLQYYIGAPPPPPPSMPPPPRTVSSSRSKSRSKSRGRGTNSNSSHTMIGNSMNNNNNNNHSMEASVEVLLDTSMTPQRDNTTTGNTTLLYQQQQQQQQSFLSLSPKPGVVTNNNNKNSDWGGTTSSISNGSTDIMNNYTHSTTTTQTMSMTQPTTNPDQLIRTQRHVLDDRTMNNSRMKMMYSYPHPTEGSFSSYYTNNNDESEDGGITMTGAGSSSKNDTINTNAQQQQLQKLGSTEDADPAAYGAISSIGSYQSFGATKIFGSSSHGGTGVGGSFATFDPIFDSRSSIVSGGDDDNHNHDHYRVQHKLKDHQHGHQDSYSIQSSQSDQYSKHFVSNQSMSPKKLQILSLVTSKSSKQPEGQGRKKDKYNNDDDDDLVIPIPPPPKVIRHSMGATTSSSESSNNNIRYQHTPVMAVTSSKEKPKSSMKIQTTSNETQYQQQHPTNYPLSPNYPNGIVAGTNQPNDIVAATTWMDPTKSNNSNTAKHQIQSSIRRRPHTTTNAQQHLRSTQDLMKQGKNGSTDGKVQGDNNNSLTFVRTSTKPSTMKDSKESTIKVKQQQQVRSKTPDRFQRFGRSKTPSEKRGKSKSPSRAALLRPTTTSKAKHEEQHHDAAGGNIFTSILRSKSTSDHHHVTAKTTTSKRNDVKQDSSSTVATIATELKTKKVLAMDHNHHQQQIKTTTNGKRTKTPEKQRSKTPERLRNMMKMQRPTSNVTSSKSTIPELIVSGSDNASVISTMTKTTNVVTIPSPDKSSKKGFFRKLFRGGGGNRRNSKGKTIEASDTFDKIVESSSTINDERGEKIQEEDTTSLMLEDYIEKSNEPIKDIESSDATALVSQPDEKVQLSDTMKTLELKSPQSIPIDNNPEKELFSSDDMLDPDFVQANEATILTPSETSAMKPDRLVDSSNVPAVQQDKPEVFYTSDDISTLTFPTIEAPGSFGIVQNTSSFGSSIRSAGHHRHYHRRRGDDPSVHSGHSSDPMGRYWKNSTISKIEESQVDEGTVSAAPTPSHKNTASSPRGTDPSSSSRTAKRPMAVDTKKPDASPHPTTKPVADKKFHDPSPQGIQSFGGFASSDNDLSIGKTLHDPSPQGIRSFGTFASSEDDVIPKLVDPFGESPRRDPTQSSATLHNEAPTAPDPPLYMKVLHLDESDLYIPDNEDENRPETLTNADGSGSVTEASDLVKVNEEYGHELHATTTAVSKQRETVTQTSTITRIPSMQSKSKMVSILSAKLPRKRPPSLMIHTPEPILGKATTVPTTNATPRITNALPSAPSPVIHEEDNESAIVPIISPRVGVLLQKVISKSPRYKTRQVPKSSSMLSISPSHSEASSVFSETMATRKAKQRLTMSKAARVNAKAVALLHTIYGQPSPRNCWQEVDNESVVTSSSAITEFLQGSGAISTVLPQTKVVPETRSLFSSLRKGKFKDRKPIVPVHDHETVVVPMSKVETAVSQLQGKLNVQLGISPARTRSSGSSYKGRQKNSFEGDNINTTTMWGQPFPEIDQSSQPRNANEYLVDIDECFPEFSPKNQESSKDAFVFTEYNGTDVSFQRKGPDTLHCTSASNSKRAQRDTTISKFAVLKGYEMLRNQREADIATGKSVRAIPSSTKRKLVAPTRSQEYEPLDPIQRAGRRLLSKAAVPIQAAARRYLAQLEAVDRMWALIEIQSYIRRWRAEAVLVSSRISAIIIQAAARKFLAVNRQTRMKKSAVLVQKVVRGYLVAAKTYDTIYCIVLVQAQVRGWVTRFKIRRHQAQIKAAAQLEASIKLQTWWRSLSSRMVYEFLRYDTVVAQCAARRFLARQRVNKMRLERANASAIKIQAAWRGIQTYSAFIFYLVDIMLLQRAVRCWIAKREVHGRRINRSAVKIQTTWRRFVMYNSYKQFKSVLLLQAVYRGHAVRVANRRNLAATTIQKEWRCFSTYTDYIFALADIIRIQTATRKWFLKRDAASRERNHAATMIQGAWRSHRERHRYKDILKRVVQIQCITRCHIAKNILCERGMECCATKIQKNFRRYSARLAVLHDFVRVILIQSALRGFLARRKVMKMLTDNKAAETERAAVAIQSAWRGFWHYSHYIILQYEIVRIQSVVRGKMCRNDFNLKLGCIIMIQAAVRKFLAMKKVNHLKVTEVWAGGQVQRIIDVQASRRIQYWWKVVMECRKEKKAALIIERFFLMIKREIEYEIQRREKSKQDKRKRHHRGKKKEDDKLLESAWLDTVDSATDIFSFASSGASDVFDFSPKQRTRTTSEEKIAPSPVVVVKTPIGKSEKLFKETGLETATRKNISSINLPQKSSRHSSTELSSTFSKKTDAISHRNSSPPKHLVMRHEYDEMNPSVTKQRPSSARVSSRSGTDSDRSAVSPLRRAKELTSRKKNIMDLSENLSLEEAYLDASILIDKERRKQSKTAPHKSSRKNRFFADDLESIDDGCTFLDEVTEAAELVADISRARTEKITSDLASAIQKTRLTIQGATESIANPTLTSFPSSASLQCGPNGFGSSMMSKYDDKTPDIVYVEPTTKSGRSKTPKSNPRTPTTSTRSPTKGKGEQFSSPRKSSSGVRSTVTYNVDMESNSPRKMIGDDTRATTTPRSMRHNTKSPSSNICHSKELSEIKSPNNSSNRYFTTMRSPSSSNQIQQKQNPPRDTLMEDDNDIYDNKNFGMI